MDEALANWFVGFVEGEGCFYAGVNRNGVFQVSFCVAQRWDNQEALAICLRLIPFGSVHRRERGYSKPVWSWVVSRNDGLCVVRDFFDRYPLRTRKASDFAIWRELVAIKLEGRSGRRRTSEQQDQIAQLVYALRAGRDFQEAA